MRIDGLAINPAARALPRDFIETGVSAIDLMNSLVRGQKLPLFSGAGLPHDRLATEIVLQSRLRQATRGSFAVVFVGMGISHDTAETFRDAMASSGALEHTAMFLNLADEPSAQRLLTPRYALTAAEYLAFVEGRHVLVVMTDMTNYCEALREVSARPRRAAEPQGLSGIHVLRSREPVRARRLHPRAAGHAHPAAHSDDARGRHQPPHRRI